MIKFTRSSRRFLRTPHYLEKTRPREASKRAHANVKIKIALGREPITNFDRTERADWGE